MDKATHSGVSPPVSMLKPREWLSPQRPTPTGPTSGHCSTEVCAMVLWLQVLVPGHQGHQLTLRRSGTLCRPIGRAKQREMMVLSDVKCTNQSEITTNNSDRLNTRGKVSIRQSHAHTQIYDGFKHIQYTHVRTNMSVCGFACVCSMYRDPFFPADLSASSPSQGRSCSLHCRKSSSR